MGDEIRSCVGKIQPIPFEFFCFQSKDDVVMVPVYPVFQVDNGMSIILSGTQSGLLDLKFVSGIQFSRYLQDTGTPPPPGFTPTEAPFEGTWEEACSYAKWAGKDLPDKTNLVDAEFRPEFRFPHGLRQWCRSWGAPTLRWQTEEGLRSKRLLLVRGSYEMDPGCWGDGTKVEGLITRAAFRCWIDASSPSLGYWSMNPPEKAVISQADPSCPPSAPVVK